MVFENKIALNKLIPTYLIFISFRIYIIGKNIKQKE